MPLKAAIEPVKSGSNGITIGDAPATPGTVTMGKKEVQKGIGIAEGFFPKLP
jgi:hypothetical protein